jgi:ketosteroid isomerase-like protein
MRMSPLSVVQSFYDLLAKGDVPDALGMLDPDIEWTEAERTPNFSGTMKGVDAVVSGLFAPLGRDFKTFITAPHEFVTDGERVVSFGRYSGVAKSTDRLMSAPFVHVWTVSNNRLRRFLQYTDSASWNEALGIDYRTGGARPRYSGLV